MPIARDSLVFFALLAGFGAVGAFSLTRPAPGAAPATVDPLAADLEARFHAEAQPLLARYCVFCHGEDEANGGVRFDGIETLDDALAMGDTLAMALELVRTHQMPPDGPPPPTAGEVEVLAGWMRDALDYVPADGRVDPGWFVIHRLNRTEYRNTLRDLLGIDPEEHDVASGLPQDDTGYGFDNIAAVLSVSPLLIEGYLDAAERALDIALGPAVVESDEPRPLDNLRRDGHGRELASGGHMLLSNGAVIAEFDAPAAGAYELVISAWGDRGGDELPRLSVRVDGRETRAFFVEGLRDEPETLRVRLALERGPRRIALAFTNDYWQQGVADRNLAVAGVGLAGPLPGSVRRPEAYARVFSEPIGDGSYDAARAAAETTLGRFARRAFRGPVESGELDRLVSLYDASRSAGDTHEEAVRLGLMAVLVSPRFLFRAVDNPHADDPERVYALDGYELASRLSYFLWSSTPDEELLSLAADGSLADERVLREQVRRMMRDPKSDAFVENFAGQWLHLRNLERLEIDRERFPAYTDELREAMITEATMFFGEVVRKDRSVLTLIDSDFTYVNGPLAALYGFAELAGEDTPGQGAAFRRVPLPEDSPRGGVLTMGAVLTVTSNPSRTSPVKRGLYVLEQILGTPPPPPPPEIPPLEQAVVPDMDHATLRERLKAHLTDPGCASCHNRMDPLGFAMENFDAIGAWRESDEYGRIDASGRLPGGVRFEGPEELKGILLGRDDLFVENLTRKLMTYALGRGLESFDRPTVTRVVRDARSRNDRIGAIIEGVVLSDAFRTTRGVRAPGDDALSITTGASR